ncbi:MAG: hypothetical protein JSW66_10510 [Phycisphaerales bacterium]|nr:MAG: hypothetical protein JSW66_10510 [Phycisphaerales bacterium]
MSDSSMNRREFVGLTTASIAGGVLGLGDPARAGGESNDWDPDRPFIVAGRRKLTIQPVLMYSTPERREASSWKSWGGVLTDRAASQEAERISAELNALAAEVDFPIAVLPVVRAKTIEQASAAHKNNYDVVIVYPAAGSGNLLRACFAREKNRDTIIFVRHRSGPVYYWYEALSVRYLDTNRNAFEQNNVSNHGPVHVDDVVVDDNRELLWRLGALYGVKNFIGARIVALGGPWGKYSPEAPAVAREKYKIEIVEVTYDEATPRIKSADRDSRRVSQAQKFAEQYLALPNTTCTTDRQFVANAFLLHGVFKDLMCEHDASAFTIRSCMTAILPIAQTTPCLSLSLLNDEGLLAFCESDFVIIPAGILLRHISGTPVFLHNSTFPHDGVVTCAHCSAPRRMDGTRYEPARIMTHYESEYGAAPKVELPPGRAVTFIDPEYSTGRWLGFTGVVRDNPSLEICRSQHDVEIQGDWKTLIREVRDSHWMMAYGDHLKEIGYACRKIGINWINLSQT